MSETLYNGIVLPRTWPPRHVDPGSREPLPVPYLEHPPAVIPIDLGRQLFVDDFLISETTLKRRFGRPQVHPRSPVLVPATPHELDGGQCPTAAPFNDGLWHDPADGLYKLWYLSGWMSTPALATSADGYEWERPELDVVPGTNLVWPTSPTYERDGCAVWLGSCGSRFWTREETWRPDTRPPTAYRWPGTPPATGWRGGVMRSCPGSPAGPCASGFTCAGERCTPSGYPGASGARARATSPPEAPASTDPPTWSD